MVVTKTPFRKSLRKRTTQILLPNFLDLWMHLISRENIILMGCIKLPTPVWGRLTNDVFINESNKDKTKIHIILFRQCLKQSNQQQ